MSEYATWNQQALLKLPRDQRHNIMLLIAEVERLRELERLSREMYYAHEAAGEAARDRGIPPTLQVDCERTRYAWCAWIRAAEAGKDGE